MTVVAIDSARQKQLHAGVLVLGVVALIVSFISRFWRYSVSAGSLGGGTYGVSAWTGYAVLSGLLLLVATAAIVTTFLPNVRVPVLPQVLWLGVTGATGLAFLLWLLRGLTYPHASESALGFSVKEGIGWSGWLLLIIMLALSAGSFLLSQSPPVPGSTPIPGGALFSKAMQSAQSGMQQPGMQQPPPVLPPPPGTVPPPADPVNPPSNTMQPPV